MAIRQKEPSKETRVPILVRYIIGEETRFHKFWGLAIFYLLPIHLEKLAAENTTECIIGMRFGTWCIVKLNYYFNFFIYFLILTVANYIRNLGIKIIFWRWGVGYVTMTSKISITYDKIAYFYLQKILFLKIG